MNRLFSDYLVSNKDNSLKGIFSITNQTIEMRSDGEVSVLHSLQLSDSITSQLLHYGAYALKTKKTVSFPLFRWLDEEQRPNIALRTLVFKPLTDQLLEINCDVESIVSCTSLVPAVSHSLLNAIEDVVLITETATFDSPGPRVIFVNAAFEKMTGYAASEILGKTPRILQGPKTLEKPRQNIRLALSDWKPCRIELTNYKKDGSIFSVELNISPVADETGWWTHWISIQRDINEQLHNARLLALGELAASIGHEINNPLAIANGYIEYIAADLEKAEIDIPKIKEYIQKYEIASNRVSNIIKGMRTLATKHSSELQPIDVVDCVRQSLSLVTESYAQVGVTIQSNLTDNSTWIQGDAIRFQQCLMNLLSNAKDAIAQSRIKRITVDVESDDNDVKIRVQDSGSGIPELIQKKIFQPFFSTKPLGKGTGIGLSTVFSLVQQMQGKIEFENKETGVEFRLCFPHLKSNVVLRDLQSLNTPVRRTQNSYAGLSCLVVDDEAELVQLLSSRLRKIGFKVSGEISSQKALENMSENKYDLLLTDLRMPNLNGLELIAEVQKLTKTKPKHIFLLTGDVKYEDQNAPLRAQTLGISGILAKPYSFRIIEEHISDAFFPNDN